MLKACGVPWIAAGDWNLEPSKLIDSGWPAMVGAKVVATACPTCNSHIYDFFVVAEVLSNAVTGIQRHDDAASNPHYPVRMFIRSNMHRRLVRRLIRPLKVEAYLPAGPSLPPPDYGALSASCASLGEADLAQSIQL